MALDIDAAWAKKGAESTKAQAERVWKDLKKRLDDGVVHIGFLYSANSKQVEAITDKKKLISKILEKADGQGAFFRELFTLIEGAGDKYQNRIHLLAIPTSLSGGDNKQGNVVSLTQLNDALSKVESFSRNFSVMCFEQNNKYATGGAASSHFYEGHPSNVRNADPHRVVGYKQDVAITQGDYVQDILKQIANSAQPFKPVEYVKDTPYSQAARKALSTYLEHTNRAKVRLSFWHAHGKTGLTNAFNLLKDILSAENLEQQKARIITYLKDGPGNWYPHSFKRILAEELFDTFHWESYTFTRNTPVKLVELTLIDGATTMLNNAPNDEKTLDEYIKKQSPLTPENLSSIEPGDSSPYL